MSHDRQQYSTQERRVTEQVWGVNQVAAVATVTAVSACDFCSTKSSSSSSIVALCHFCEPESIQNYPRPPTRASNSSKQEAHKISFVRNNVLDYKFSPSSNIVGCTTITQIRKRRFRYGTLYYLSRHDRHACASAN
jgi:hypothetical protein